jgi:hypothetical protein
MQQARETNETRHAPDNSHFSGQFRWPDYAASYVVTLMERSLNAIQRGFCRYVANKGSQPTPTHGRYRSVMTEKMPTVGSNMATIGTNRLSPIPYTSVPKHLRMGKQLDLDRAGQGMVRLFLHLWPN